VLNGPAHSQSAQPSQAGSHLRGLLRSLQRWKVAAVALALTLVIATLGIGIATSESQSRSHILSLFKLRGTSSATFVSTFLAQQADRESQTAGRFLSGSHVSPQRFETVVSAFGSGAAVLLNSHGMVLDAVPADPALTGKPIADRYAHLQAAEQGRVAVSGVVPSAVSGVPVAAVAVPFSTPSGRRVFSAAYPTSGSTLGAFVDHTIAYRPHGVYLVDATGNIVAASPKTATRRLRELDPSLAHAIGSSSLGPVGGPGTARTFTAASVPGTSWRLVIAVPDSRLFSSIDGWQQRLPWVVFALVTVLAVALLLVVARLTALSERMAANARTDALTGLPNRRAVSEHLTRATARARRSGRPVSVLMIDLDRFKETNDRFGHQAGDRVLCAVADCMRGSLRGEDIYGRWGGDEFLVLLPDTDETEAQHAAERLRRQADAVDLGDIGLPDGVPMSIGSATGTTITPEDLVHEADLALYEQKTARRHGAGTQSHQLELSNPLELSR
jgi:diguanylate cyclase (GGDEF)-like protein